MHDAGCLGLVHWDDPEGWYGEGGGRRVQDGEHMYNFFLLKKIKKKRKILIEIENHHLNTTIIAEKKSTAKNNG